MKVFCISGVTALLFFVSQHRLLLHHCMLTIQFSEIINRTFILTNWTCSNDFAAVLLSDFLSEVGLANYSIKMRSSKGIKATCSTLEVDSGLDGSWCTCRQKTIYGKMNFRNAKPALTLRLMAHWFMALTCTSACGYESYKVQLYLSGTRRTKILERSSLQFSL